MTELREKISNVLEEKNAKIIPENIKAGVTIFDVEGTYEGEEGLDTSDATATVNDIKAGQTAYVNGQKITGVVPYYGQKIFTDGTIYNVSESSVLRFIKTFDTGVAGFNYGGACIVQHPYSKVASSIGLTADKIATGQTVLGIEGTHSGLDTSDATATVSDIAGGKTAYVNGQKITGELTEYTSSNGGFVNQAINSNQARASLNSGKLQVQANASQNFLARQGAMISVFASSDIIAKAIGLTADKIAEGNTILDIVGTHSGLDTSNATATSLDIVEGKTAYVNEQLVTGIVPSYNSTKPVELRGTYEIIDSTNPYFILTKQTTRGVIYNDILKLPASAIDPSWIKDKSFVIRINNTNESTSIKYRIELDVAPKGSKFKFSSSPTSRGWDMGIIAYDNSNKLIPFTIYYCFVNTLEGITSSAWYKEEKTDTSTYAGGKLSDIQYIYAYSSDASIKNGSHSASDGVPAMNDKIVIKDTVNSITNGVHINNNTEIYTKIPQSDIATHIGLTSSMIAKGQSVLGVAGSLEVLDTSDADATAADIIKDKTAYVNGQKITGTAILGVDISDATINEGDVAEGKLAYSSAGRITGTLPNITDTLEYGSIDVVDNNTNSRLDLTITNETDRIVRKDVTMHSTIGYSSLASTIGLTAEKLVRGNTILGIEGTQALGYDTSDATAVAGDIVSGKTAYINGGVVTGTLTAVTGNLTVPNSEITLSDNTNGKVLGLTHQLTEKAIYDTGSTLNYQVGYSQLAQLFKITGDKIVKGNTVLGVEGTALTGDHYPQLYTSIEAMSADTTKPDGTFAIVYGTTYDGTFICSSGVWEQIGQPTETVETYNSLSLMDEDEATYYEGMGGTEEEIVTVLDKVLGNEEEV